MNYLAHTLLANGDAGLETGGIMGDFVRGRPDASLPEGIRVGIALHRAIDGYTDRHPDVVAARRLFDPPFRRYAGIMLDVWFDHCLAVDFARWSDMPLTAFSRRLIGRLDERRMLMPPSMQRFLDWMQAHGAPASYADEAVIGLALQGIGGRLKRDNPLDRSLPALQARSAPLQACFSSFFPQLTSFAAQWRVAHPLHAAPVMRGSGLT